MILIVGSVVSAMVSWKRMETLQNLDSEAIARLANGQLKEGGIEGLRKFIVKTEDTYYGLRVYVIDSHGADMLDRRLPDRWQRRVERMLRVGFLTGCPRGEVCRIGDPMGMTPQIVADDGSVYTLLFSYTSSPPFNVMGPGLNFLLLLIAVALSGMVCWWLAASVSRPVARLQASARALAAGDLGARVGEEFANRRDELGVLGREFDRMAEQVRKLLNLKESLLRDVSHELRSPLARLQVALGLARRPAADVARELDRIEREAERLDDLIGGMLRWSQLRDMPKFAPQTVDLSGLLIEVADDAQLEASASGKAVRWHAEPEVQVVGDGDMLRSAIENVLRNAVRFTATATQVSVQLVRRGEEAVLTVRDQGPGVPERDLERIFEPFFRVAEARDRNTGGTGLGLAITARVVALHAGQVRMRNAPGGGLIAEIVLPLQPGPVEAEDLERHAEPALTEHTLSRGASV